MIEKIRHTHSGDVARIVPEHKDMAGCAHATCAARQSYPAAKASCTLGMPALINHLHDEAQDEDAQDCLLKIHVPPETNGF